MMGKGRLEAFSDGVFAIVITTTVLELKVPHGAEFSPLAPLVPVLMSHVLSFVMVGIHVLVALIWFAPDRRIERTISKN